MVHMLLASGRMCLLEFQEPQIKDAKIGGPLKSAALFGRTVRTCLTPALAAIFCQYNVRQWQYVLE